MAMAMTMSSLHTAERVRCTRLCHIVDMVKELRIVENLGTSEFSDENLMTVHAASRRTWLSDLCDLWIAEGLQPKTRRDGREMTEADIGDGVFWSEQVTHPCIILRFWLRCNEVEQTHLVYGLESFDPKLLKGLGKETNRSNNISSSVDVCMSSGIKPIPNIMLGFPDETYESVRNTITALIELGIHAKPHFATAYPGSEWFNTFKDSLTEQYGGDLEQYVLDLGDATKITGTISKYFTPVELLGLQKIVHDKDLRNLELTENILHLD